MAVEYSTVSSPFSLASDSLLDSIFFLNISTFGFLLKNKIKKKPLFLTLSISSWPLTVLFASILNPLGWLLHSEQVQIILVALKLFMFIFFKFGNSKENW